MFILSISLLAATCLCTPPAPWNPANNPKKFEGKNHFSYHFETLPDEGLTQQIPWSDTYWPSFQSGIAHRWNSPKPDDFKYHLNTKAELQKMSVATFKTLSPAEKFDIYMGRYDYPTVKSEWQRTSPNDAQWEGLCHGWAPASQFYEQPNPVTLTNKDGLSIPFGSSDVKALLTYFVAMYDEAFASTTYIAERCNYDLDQQPKLENRSACADMNAGTFHVILTNQIGQLRKGFIVDRDRSAPVWNQPVFYFNYTLTEMEAKRGAAQTFQVQTLMVYGKETQPMWDAHQVYPVGEWYEYEVDLDSNGNITGGDYVWPDWDRVDFAWNLEILDFSGYFASLSKIYSASVNGSSLDFSSARTPYTERPNHNTHDTLSGKLEQGPYESSLRKSWSISCSVGAPTFELHWIESSDVMEPLRIYEGADGQGALIGVLYGSKKDITIEVSTTSAYVSFTVPEGTPGGSGFSMTYVCQE